MITVEASMLRWLADVMTIRYRSVMHMLVVEHWATLRDMDESVTASGIPVGFLLQHWIRRNWPADQRTPSAAMLRLISIYIHGLVQALKADRTRQEMYGLIPRLRVVR